MPWISLMLHQCVGPERRNECRFLASVVTTDADDARFSRSLGVTGTVWKRDRVDIGDRLRDLNGLRIADGATDVMRSSVVSDRFGREFWEMAIQRRERQPIEASQVPEE